MKKNKRGVSLMLSYVILIAITVSISIAVFAWLRVISNIKPIASCEEETSMFISDYECKDNYLALKARNNGLFDIEGFILNVGDNELKNPVVNLIPLEEGKISREGFYLFQPVLNPTKEATAIFSNAEKTPDGRIKKINFDNIKIIKIQPFIIDEKSKETILCDNVIKQKIDNCHIKGENTAQPEHVVCALNLYNQAKDSGMIFSSQCLGVCGDYAVDVVHTPREEIDDQTENQCEDYINGNVNHFIELDHSGNIVRIE